MARNSLLYLGEHYIAIDYNDADDKKCGQCDIAGFEICDAAWCSHYERADEREVIFKKTYKEATHYTNIAILDRLIKIYGINRSLGNVMENEKAILETLQKQDENS